MALASLLVIACDALAAGPDGLYLMTRMSGSSLEMRGWYFKNGQVSSQPRGELATFDFKAAAAETPSATGSYAISGNAMTIKYADGKERNAKYEAKDKGCFYWDAGLFCPVKPFDKGTKLDGVFTGGASSGTGATSAVTLTLSSNGQYKMTSAASVSSTSARSTVTAGSQGEQSGTYELAGTQLTLKPAAGEPRKVLVFPYDDGSKLPMPHRMFFDGGMLKRLQ